MADSISTIADIPGATSNTRAVNFCNLMYVLGGGFNAPTNEVEIYDPVSNTWSLGTPFPTAGRNFAADTDGTNNIWKAGGYDSGRYHNRLDGNLQLPGESLWVAFAYADGNRNVNGKGHSDSETRSDAAAASHTAASALRPAFTVVPSGTRDHSRVPALYLRALCPQSIGHVAIVN